MDGSLPKLLHQDCVTSSKYGAQTEHNSLASGSNGPTEWSYSSSEPNSLTDSTSHSHSPTSSVDSCRISPRSLPRTSTQAARSHPCKMNSLPAPEGEEGEEGQPVRKVRLRYPGKERQSASEREKLRMRGLAKALHNLRTYLPPSVVPASQSLTKLETLRLTIRYISHLTELLRLSEESPSEGSDTEGTYQGYPQDLGYCQDKSQSPPSECLAHSADLIMKSESHVLSGFQDVTLCQSFTENNGNLQLVPWYPWQH
ncbi:mesogenin-1-like [Chiloscyllium plagiosum]|uniref:mesogenin-1-like n=1 Tax=Chiloscyllium plagiosum TaxID=36176 RepID=UPI001CB7CA48|nr:mesogenin-1-like [Chiloscyllium plagiosum]